MTKRGKPSLVDKIIRLLVQEPTRNVTMTPIGVRRVLASPAGDGRIVGYEAEVRFKHGEIYAEEKIQYEETSIAPYRHRAYILLVDACKKYGLSTATIRSLCRDRIIYCEKRGGRWVIYEETLIEFLTDSER